MDASRHDGVDRRRELLALLADGDVHSGAALAARLGVSRTAVWHYARELTELGVSLSAVRGSGYQLDAPIELLDEASIRSAMSAEAVRQLRGLDVRFITDSTNQRLVDLGPDADRRVCLAESQTAGRGRRGRQWVGEIGRGLFLSLGWRFACPMQNLAGLSLVAGIGVQRAVRAMAGLRPAAAARLRLKWPNDILVDDRKLGGVLVEVSGEMQGPCIAVIGVGINVSLSAAARTAIAAQPAAQAAADLDSIFEHMPPRNRLAAALTDSLIASMQRFESGGFASFAEDWRGLDALAGRPVVVETDAGRVEGIAGGVDGTGALCVETNGTVRHYHGGEVRVRTGDATAG
jgi:BirA family biotin operon repressor/biotin-[acetyl-CoA-carboxylase] ligase